MRNFKSGGAQRVQERILSDERIYREYVTAPLGLEAQMRTARAVLHDEIPKLKTLLKLLERAGVAQLDCDGPAWGARLDRKSSGASSSRFRKEQRALRRTRSISMDR